MFPNEEEWRCSLCVSPGQGDARLLVQLLISSRANEGRQADQRPGGVYAGCALCLNMNLRPGWCAWADDKRDRSTQDSRICIRHVPRVCKSYIAGSSEAWQPSAAACLGRGNHRHCLSGEGKWIQKTGGCLCSHYQVKVR